MRFGLSAACALAFVAGVLAVPPTPVAPRQANPQTSAITDFAEPWALAFLPDNRILVTEKRGNLRLVDPATKAKGAITGVPAVRYADQGGFGGIRSPAEPESASR